MSVAVRLFKRAPIWRTCLLFGVGFGILTYICPADYLSRRFPKVFHEHIISPDAQKNAAGQQGHFLFSDPDRTVQGHVAFAGHSLALPPGNWSPLLTAQDGPNGEVVFLSMMRIENGMVSGILTAEATSSPAVGIIPADFLLPCHDDRMHDRVTIDQTAQKESCGFMNQVTLLPLDAASTSELIKATLARITSLGYPLRPQMMDRGWRMQQQLTVRSNIAAVDYLSLNLQNPNQTLTHNDLVQWAQMVSGSFKN